MGEGVATQKNQKNPKKVLNMKFTVVFGLFGILRFFVILFRFFVGLFRFFVVLLPLSFGLNFAKISKNHVINEVLRGQELPNNTSNAYFFYLTLILIRTLQQPHVTHKCNGQLQEAECTIIHTRQ